MATWQFDLFLVPPTHSADVAGSVEHVISAIERPVLERARAALSQQLGKPWKMVPGVQVYGQENGHRIDVCVGEDGAGEIQARIDARVESIAFCRQVSRLAEDLGLILYLPETAEMLEPGGQTLQYALERSGAAAYVRGA